VTAVASPQGSSWRIDVGGIEIARSTAPLGAKTIDVAIERATAQIKALIDALAPFSALAAEAERLQAKVTALQIEAGSWRRQFDAARDALDARHAEAAHADEVVASTRTLLNEAHAALARQEVRIAELEAKADTDADAATVAHLEAHLSQADKRIARYVRRVEMAVMGPEDADEECGQ
jgi:chromosome segregation ATPase